jgi:hypothetical protein
VHNVIFENGGGEIFVSINTLLRINVALVAYCLPLQCEDPVNEERTF